MSARGTCSTSVCSRCPSCARPRLRVARCRCPSAADDRLTPTDACSQSKTQIGTRRLMKRVLGTISAIVMLTLWAAEAAAQQRPLVTEDPETIGAGLVLLEGGLDRQRQVSYPVSG